MIIDNNDRHVGRMYMNQSQGFEVRLINDESEEIHITQVKPGCGSCTSVSLNTTKIPIGGEAILSVVFTPNSTGEYTKIIKIYFNNKEAIFTFRVTV